MSEPIPLTPGMVIQLSWRNQELVRVDRSVEDKMATVVEETEQGWKVRDEQGCEHWLVGTVLGELQEARTDSNVGRWRLCGAVPAYRLGERLVLHWRHRSPSRPVQLPKPNETVTIVEASTESVTIEFSDGRRTEMYRFGVENVPNRAAPRWFVIARLDSESHR